MDRIREILVSAANALADELDTLRCTSGDEYRSDGPLPHGLKRERYAEICRSGRVLGARKEGHVWICTRRAWHAARARKPAAITSGRPVNDAAARADELIAAAGYRRTR